MLLIALRQVEGSGTFAELLIDCGEDWTLRAVLVGMLPEAASGACRDAAGGRSLDLTQDQT